MNIIDTVKKLTQQASHNMTDPIGEVFQNARSTVAASPIAPPIVKAWQTVNPNSGYNQDNILEMQIQSLR